jgi:NAD(P)-dependent dehydrogenase (short-subunit alcohol dehydrogenase family)
MATEPDFSLPAQAGRRFVVTGGNSGLGLETVRRLALAGANVVLAARSPEKGAAAVEQLRAAQPEADIEFAALDLADLRSIEDFAEKLVADERPVDVLINNAGIMAVPTRHETADGFELQFGTNHLGHFALTGRLLPALRRASAPRVVTMSSVAHRVGRIDFDNLDGRRSYNGWRAYAQSKLANLLFVKELGRRSEANGWGIVSAGAHPGSTRTNLQSSGPQLGKEPSTKNGSDASPGFLDRFMTLPAFSQEPDVGALPELFAATWASVKGGDYIGPKGAFELTGAPARAKENPRARDEQLAARLWTVSEDLTGVHY